MPGGEVAAQQEREQRRLGGSGDDVAGQHHPAAVEPVDDRSGQRSDEDAGQHADDGVEGVLAHRAGLHVDPHRQGELRQRGPGDGQQLAEGDGQEAAHAGRRTGVGRLVRRVGAAGRSGGVAARWVAPALRSVGVAVRCVGTDGRSVGVALRRSRAPPEGGPGPFLVPYAVRRAAPSYVPSAHLVEPPGRVVRLPRQAARRLRAGQDRRVRAGDDLDEFPRPVLEEEVAGLVQHRQRRAFREHLPLAVPLLVEVGRRVPVADHRDHRGLQQRAARLDLGQRLGEVDLGGTGVGAHVADHELHLGLVEVADLRPHGAQPGEVDAVAQQRVQGGDPAQQPQDPAARAGEGELGPDVDGLHLPVRCFEETGHGDGQRAADCAVPVQGHRPLDPFEDLGGDLLGQLVERQVLLGDAHVVAGDGDGPQVVSGGQLVGDRLVDDRAAAAVRDADEGERPLAGRSRGGSAGGADGGGRAGTRPGRRGRRVRGPCGR